MSEDTHRVVDDKHPAEIIVLKLLGYLLLILGVIALLGVGYQVYELYQHPDLVSRFATSLREMAGEESVPFTLLKIAAWQVVIVLLLTAGKIAVWLIESGRRLVNIR